MEEVGVKLWSFQVPTGVAKKQRTKADNPPNKRQPTLKREQNNTLKKISRRQIFRNTVSNSYKMLYTANVYFWIFILTFNTS